MHAVVIDRLSGEPGTLAKAAAQVLNSTAYDVRASMNVPGGGPAVLVVLADLQQAEAIRAELERAGFEAKVVAVEHGRAWFHVREFEFHDHALEVGARGGERFDMPYGTIDLLLRVSAVTTETKTKTVRERKFAPMRSVLSGGLVNTKVQTTKETTRSSDSEELLVVFGGATAPLWLAEREILYQGLGPELQPSRMANFMHVVDELRRRCPQAKFDERLRKRSVQSQMLGRTLSADEYVDFAVSLVAASLLGRS